MTTTLPHTTDLAKLEQDIADLKSWVAELERQRMMMRRANTIAENHGKGWFSLEEFTTEYSFATTFKAFDYLEIQRNRKRIEQHGIAWFSYVPQSSATEWCAELPVQS